MTLYTENVNQRATPRWLRPLGLAVHGVCLIAFVAIPGLYGILGLSFGATWAMVGNQNPQLRRVLVGAPTILTSVAYLVLAVACSYLLFCPRSKQPRPVVFFALYFAFILFVAAGGFLP